MWRKRTWHPTCQARVQCRENAAAEKAPCMVSAAVFCVPILHAVLNRVISPLSHYRRCVRLHRHGAGLGRRRAGALPRGQEPQLQPGKELCCSGSTRLKTARDALLRCRTSLALPGCGWSCKRRKVWELKSCHTQHLSPSTHCSGAGLAHDPPPLAAQTSHGVPAARAPRGGAQVSLVGCFGLVSDLCS